MKRILAITLITAMLFTGISALEVRADSVPILQIVTQPDKEYKNGDTITFTVQAPNYSGKVEYRVILYNGTTKTTKNLWDTPKTGYYYKGWQPNGNMKFDIHWPVSQMEPGAYSMTVLVRKANSSKSYDSHVDTKSFYVVGSDEPVSEEENNGGNEQSSSSDEQVASLNRTIENLRAEINAKDKIIKDLQNQIATLEKNSNVSGYIELPDVSNVSPAGVTTINLPFDTNSNPVYGASIEKGGKSTSIVYEVSGKNLNIILDGNVSTNSTYNLRIFTKSGQNYIARLGIPEHQKIAVGNGEEKLIKVPAKPEKGFNYDYYVWIPANINPKANNYLLVESNNSGGVSDNISFHENIVKDSFREYGLLWQLSDRLSVPVMMPVFPRPETGWEVYTHDLDRDTVLINDGQMKRLDLQLIAMIKDAQSLLSYNGVKMESKIFMEGYSASAKFANKFTVLHPEIVKAVATGGVNACTLLPIAELEGSKLRYPVGISDYKEITGYDFNEAEYRKVAQYIFMGEKDTNDITQFRDGYDEVDAELTWKVLGKQMMPDRWNKLMKVYKDLGYDSSIQFHTYKGIGHSITDKVIEDLVKFFQSNTGNKIVKIQPNING